VLFQVCLESLMIHEGLRVIISVEEGVFYRIGYIECGIGFLGLLGYSVMGCWSCER
jgi:hypothetical protein